MKNEQPHAAYLDSKNLAHLEFRRTGPQKRGRKKNALIVIRRAPNPWQFFWRGGSSRGGGAYEPLLLDGRAGLTSWRSHTMPSVRSSAGARPVGDEHVGKSSWRDGVEGCCPWPGVTSSSSAITRRSEFELRSSESAVGETKVAANRLLRRDGG